jgi:heterodisulfide reductase subunit C
MSYLPQMFFLLCLAVAGFVLYKRVIRIQGNIRLGRKIDMSDNKSERLRKMMLIAFGQKKMFDKPLVGLLHLAVYLGFVIINIEILEIVLDGLLGTHRLFYPTLGNFYSVFINIFEALAVGVILACAIFLVRRNVIKLKRFHARELTKWPYSDANIILGAEILLMLAFLTMNATDQILQARGVYPVTGQFAFSRFLIPVFNGLPDGAVLIIERFAWWFHIIGILAFAIYITFSKHLHIVMAFPNTYFSRLTPIGKVTNMPVVTREVKSMLGLPAETPEFADSNIEEPARFGAKDVNDLNWKNLMDAYTCTECGRCTEQCPANKTGKLLSPRKIMMDTRDRMEDVGRSLEKGGPGLEDGKSLYGDYILKEEIMACTTCNACVEACPVNINPLDIIVDIRRYIAMEETKTPASWNSMFSNIENNFAPWAFSPADRFNWAEKLNNENK